MKFGKRILGLLLVMALMVGMVACTTGKKTSNASDDESKAYEIEWYFPGSFGSDQQMVEEKINEYLKEKINATLKLMPLDWGVYASKMKNMLSSGEKVDLAWCDLNQYQSYIKEQIPVEIEELMTKFAPKTKELLGEEYLNGVKIGGKLYAVPVNKEKGHAFSIIYRKDIAQKYGFDMESVKTLEDLYPYFDVIKEKEANMIPFGLTNSSTPLHLEPYYDIGLGSLVCFMPEYPGKVVTMHETEEYKKAAKRAQHMYDNGYVSKDAAIKDDFTELRKNGMIFCYVSITHPLKLEEINKSSNYEMGEVVMTDVMSDSRDTLGSLNFIPYTCENPERVMKFIELFNTDVYLNNLINFGIEDLHYEKTGENTIKTLDRIENYDFVGSQWELGNTLINYVLDGYDPQRYEKLAEYNANVPASDYYGFVFDSEPVAAQVTACRSVTGEYWKNIDYGTVNADEELPKFIEKLKKAGIEEVIAEAQKQYDAWKENK